MFIEPIHIISMSFVGYGFILISYAFSNTNDLNIIIKLNPQTIAAVGVLAIATGVICEFNYHI